MIVPVIVVTINWNSTVDEEVDVVVEYDAVVLVEEVDEVDVEIVEDDDVVVL